MQMWKKTGALLLTGSLLLGAVFTGCGKSTSTSDTGVKGGVPKDPYEIKWYFAGSLPQPDNEAVETAINEYLKDKLNVTIKLVALDYGSYNNKMTNMIAGAESFDIAFTYSSTYVLNALKGSYLPLNELIDKYAPKTKEILGVQCLKGAEVGGKVYALPANKDRAHTYGFVFRKDLVDKYQMNVKSIKKYEDILPFLQIIKDKEPGIIPFNTNSSATAMNYYDFDLINFPAVVYPDGPNEKVVNYLETPEYKKGAELMQKIYRAGYTAPDAGMKGSSTSALEKEGKIFAVSVPLKPGKDKEMSAAYKNSFEYEQVDVTEPRMMTSDVTGSMLAISRTSKKPERVMQFLEMFNTDKTLNNLVLFGIEGKHYTKVSDNIIKVNKDAGYSLAGYQWMFGNTFMNYILNTEDPNKNNLMKAFNEKAKPSRTFGFIFDAEPVKIETSVCANIRKEYSARLEYGVADVEKILPEFQAKIKQAGGEKIITEVQKQYDEWKAKNGK